MEFPSIHIISGLVLVDRHLFGLEAKVAQLSKAPHCITATAVLYQVHSHSLPKAEVHSV